MAKHYFKPDTRTKPHDAQEFVYGSWYKVARRRVWRWNGREWLRSTKTPREVRAPKYNKNH